MKLIRWVLGRVILFIDFLYNPKGTPRSLTEQASLDQSMSHLSLYQFAACPFCVKVRWSMKRHALKIETRDAKRSPKHAEDLLKGGGELQVPCLRIDSSDGTIQWMYESNDIIDYLENQFNLTTAANNAY